MTLPSLAEPYMIEEDFCGDCGESFGWDVRPLTVRCPRCAVVDLVAAEPRRQSL